MTPTMQIRMKGHGFPLGAALAASLTMLLASTPVVAQSAEAASPEKERSPAYGGSLFAAESLGVSAGFHRWLGRVGTHYGDCVGAVLLVAMDEPWLGNHFYFGAAFATAVGQYGDPDAANIFAAVASSTEYLDEGRSFGGTTALPPLDFSYSTLAARAGYRLRTKRFISGGAYVDLGYGLVGTVDDAQMNGFVAIGANVIIKFFPTLIMTLGLQYRQDIPVGNRITGFEDMSALAIYNSFELVKF